VRAWVGSVLGGILAFGIFLGCAAHAQNQNHPLLAASRYICSGGSVSVCLNADRCGVDEVQQTFVVDAVAGSVKACAKHDTGMKCVDERILNDAIGEYARVFQLGQTKTTTLVMVINQSGQFHHFRNDALPTLLQSFVTVGSCTPG
jgi:hypothetical protein